MDPTPSDDRRAAAHRRETAARWRHLDSLLRIVPTNVGTLPPLAFAVTCVVAFPIVIVTMLVGAGLAVLIWQLGAPDPLAVAVELVVGIGGGVALSFVVIVRIYRRLSPETRAVVFDEDDGEADPVPSIERDPDADPTTLADRLAAVDTALAPGSSGPDDDDRASSGSAPKW